MKRIVQFSIAVFLLFSSCVEETTDLNVNLELEFFNQVGAIVDNYSTYSSLTPKKINPFEFDLKIPEL